MQIRNRLTIQFTLLVSAIVLTAFVGIYALRSWYTDLQFNNRLERKARTTAIRLMRGEDPNVIKRIDQSNLDVFYKEHISIFDYRNREIYSSNDTLAFTVDRVLLDRIRLSGEWRETQGDYKIVGVRYDDRYNRVVAVAGAIDTDGQDGLNLLRNIMIGAFLVVVAFVAVAGRVFAGQALQPIAEIISEANALYPQYLNRRLRISNEKDEIGQLGLTFNNLLERVEHAFKLQNTFISNVSHELKNPLTKITSQVEVALLKERSGADYRQTLQSVGEDVRDLSQLSNTLLELARIRDAKRDVLNTEVRLDELIWEAREILLKAQPAFRVQVEFGSVPDDDDALTLLGNAHLLRTACLNLMENGCKFSNDQTVEVTLQSTESELQIQFLNHGPPIAPEQLPYIFQPFYRADSTAHVKGYGIGLSLVDRIVQVHGGRVNVQSSVGEGTRFDIQLPRRA
jgi:signal transduction histidine kinase